ncbi:hypothetical protein IHN63_01380 [Deinococcus sp. 6YEL10]|uniref:hypothetical protein n=1 Tax=Deinococcus sp. 6YEL10 TaxID=2745870 RepID=UPI001E3748D6|nr:hypothetical protein [Deinococcus sp. 6YEL10]MCD0159949.1 hypothetical protein [Deinococcus sp. 6YEL10]
MSPPNLILHATTCLTLLGLTAKAALRALEDSWQILDAETGRALGTLQGDRVTVDAATLLPEELDRCVAPLLGPPLATRFFQQFPAASGDWFLCVQGGHEISLRARDDTVLASGHLFEPTSGVLFATVNTWNPLLHTLLPAPVPVGPGSNEKQARLLDWRTLNVTPSIADSDTLAFYISRTALDATGHDHPYPYGCWYDPGHAATRTVLLLSQALTLETGERWPHGRAPYV